MLRGGVMSLALPPSLESACAMARALFIRQDKEHMGASRQRSTKDEL